MPAEFEPTTDQRALVQNAAAFGINQADIANQLNIDEKTLRKHFREELNSGKFKLPSMHVARINDAGIAFKDAVAQMVLAQELPDIFGGVQLGGIGWQVK
jgi:hypothetical protein